MKRTKQDLKKIEDFVNFTYSNFGYSLQLEEREFTSNSDPLGYCYKYSGDSVSIYNIVLVPLGKEYTDYRTKMHEYGHIYLGHLDGIHEELDGRILLTLQNHRAELIRYIENSCGIDYAEKLLDRIIDDPGLNHELHNIAMDMEVNSKVLSKEDVEEMESDITEVFGNNDSQLQLMKNIVNSDTDDSELTEDQKKSFKDFKDSLLDSIAKYKVKLIVPERYHLQDGSPFPNNLTYPEYLILIIKNLPQFIKMLVSISTGGNGDTGDITKDQVQDAIGDSMESLDNLMQSCGMKEGQGNDGYKYSGTRPTDHNSGSREEADIKRAEHSIHTSGGDGCSSSGEASGYLDTEENKDPIDMAISEVIHNFKNKVISRDYKKDAVYLYNRGINRTVIAPVYRYKTKVSYKPKIVFLIDVSGSMNTSLVSRIINQISRCMKRISKGTRYDIISWSTSLCSYITDIDPSKPSPKLRIGGGTRMAKGIEFFKSKYGKNSIMVLISDFEDYLDEWEKETDGMNGYDLYAFNYGYRDCNRKFKNLKIKNFKQ